MCSMTFSIIPCINRFIFIFCKMFFAPRKKFRISDQNRCIDWNFAPINILAVRPLFCFFSATTSISNVVIAKITFIADSPAFSSFPLINAILLLHMQYLKSLPHIFLYSASFFSFPYRNRYGTSLNLFNASWSGCFDILVCRCTIALMIWRRSFPSLCM